MGVIEGAGLGSPLQNAGAPSAGTNAVQTLTIGGTPDGGSILISFNGVSRSADWSATNATLLANIQAALDAIFGSNQVVAAVGTMTGGIGTITLTFSGATVAKLAVSTLVATSNLTGTNPTAAIAATTAGVTATGRGAPKGAQLTDTTNGLLYINTGTASSPTWTKVGTQT